MATPLQCSCLENPGDGGSLVGCRLWGRSEPVTTEATQQQQQQSLSRGRDSLYPSSLSLSLSLACHLPSRALSTVIIGPCELSPAPGWRLPGGSIPSHGGLSSLSCAGSRLALSSFLPLNSITVFAQIPLSPVKTLQSSQYSNCQEEKLLAAVSLRLRL